MKERPIIFSGAMVKAILSGRKTMTRRIVKPQPFHYEGEPCNWYAPTLEASDGEIYPGPEVFGFYDEETGTPCPYGGPKDRLWGKETFYNDSPENKIVDHIYYRADGECCEQIPECQCATVGKVKWKPSIFMSRWASRLTLEIIGIKVERLNDISEEDAKAEGAEFGFWHEEDGTLNISEDEEDSGCYRDGFGFLWESIHGPGSWRINPWVWCIEWPRWTP